MNHKKIVALTAMAGVLVLVGLINYVSNRAMRGEQTTQESAKTITAPTQTDLPAVSVSIQNYEFVPNEITVKVGQKITWTNTDIARHTVTGDTGGSSVPGSQFFGRGETYSYTFAKPGEYTYHCEPHPYMKAKIIVVPNDMSVTQADPATVHKILLLPGKAMPDSLVIKLGEYVEFDSRDGQSHDISTGIDHGPDGSHVAGSIESGVFGPDEAYRVRFSKVGLYDFHDHLDEKINFTIAVYDASATSTSR